MKSKRIQNRVKFPLVNLQRLKALLNEIIIQMQDEALTKANIAKLRYNLKWLTSSISYLRVKNIDNLEASITKNIEFVNAYMLALHRDIERISTKGFLLYLKDRTTFRKISLDCLVYLNNLSEYIGGA